MKRMLALVCTVVVGISGCSALDAKADPEQIKLICQYFSRSSHQQLLTPGTKDEIDKLRTSGGVPYEIRTAVVSYYKNQTLNGNQAVNFPQSRIDHLNLRQQEVLEQCHHAGWAENQ